RPRPPLPTPRRPPPPVSCKRGRGGKEGWSVRDAGGRAASARIPTRPPSRMMLPDDAYLALTPDLRICRILNGLWQVSGAHGPIDRAAALAAMPAYHDAGFTTWDLADHYRPAHDLIG